VASCKCITKKCFRS